MFGVAAFLGFWILVAIVLVTLAMRGGPRARRRAKTPLATRRSRRAAAVAFSVAYAGIGVAVPAVLIAGDHNSAAANAFGAHLTADEQRGRVLFGSACGQCHTLAAARTVGKVGPDFDQLKPPVPLVLDAVAHGRRRGNGTMPQGLLQGNDTRDVAAYIHVVAGK